MIKRITSNNNPDFFFMSYSKKDLEVNDFIFVPKHFFVPDIIEKENHYHLMPVEPVGLDVIY